MRSKAVVRVLPVCLDLPVYASGVVAADHVPDEVAERMRDALGAGLELQRRDPGVGVSEFLRRYPSIPRTDAEVNWSLFDRFAFPDAAPPGSMSARRWWDTIAHTVKAHHLAPVPDDRVYRSALLHTS